VLIHVGLVVAGVTVAALIVGLPALAEVAGGLLLLLLATHAGIRLTGQAASETDTGGLLILDVKLVGVVVLALGGITVMALPLVD
jgi:hypothetical protein